MYGHILIATDGTDLAGRGLEHGLALAKKLGAKVTILNVSEPFPVYELSEDLPLAGAPPNLEGFDKRAAKNGPPTRERASGAHRGGQGQHTRSTGPRRPAARSQRPTGRA